MSDDAASAIALLRAGLSASLVAFLYGVDIATLDRWAATSRPKAPIALPPPDKPVLIGSGCTLSKRDPEAERLKAEAIAAGKVRKIPPGTSGIYEPNGMVIKRKGSKARRRQNIGKRQDMGQAKRVDRGPVIDLWVKGKSVGAIAREVGCSEATVRGIIRAQRGKEAA